MKLIYFILIILEGLLASCESYKTKYNLNKLTSQPVTIPDSLIKIINCSDTNNWRNNYSDIEYKFIHFLDSSTCIPCEFGYFDKWDNILSTDSITSGKIKFYFIINPSNEYKDNICRHYQISNIKYPIFIDYHSYLEKINNHIPKSKKYHSFLLNEFDQVVYVGNPTQDSALYSLFYNILQTKYNIEHHL